MLPGILFRCRSGKHGVEYDVVDRGFSPSTLRLFGLKLTEPAAVARENPAFTPQGVT
jgi:hypothetical protein